MTVETGARWSWLECGDDADENLIQCEEDDEEILEHCTQSSGQVTRERVSSIWRRKYFWSAAVLVVSEERIHKILFVHCTNICKLLWFWENAQFNSDDDGIYENVRNVLSQPDSDHYYIWGWILNKSRGPGGCDCNRNCV